MAETTYIVLRRTGGSGAMESWEVCSRNVTAANANAAIRKGASKEPTSTGREIYVAIPARSFKPVSAITETQTVLKLEEAKLPAADAPVLPS